MTIKGRIIGRKAPMIQLCPKCGFMRVNHRTLGRNLYDCPVPQAVIDRLGAFARENGKRWKSILCDIWTRGDSIDTELQQARNMIGPRRLYKIKVG